MTEGRACVCVIGLMERLYENIEQALECPDVEKSHLLRGELENWVFSLQSNLDSFHSPLLAQDMILRMIFPPEKTRKGKKTTKERQSKSLLEIVLDKDFPGVDNTIPQTLTQVFARYKEKGLLNAAQWRLCIGNDENHHKPTLLPPDAEDAYVGNVLPCTCSPSSSRSKHKRNCETCCGRCQVCGKERKNMVRFEYLSFIEQLRLLCQSEEFCYDLLTMWRARSSWQAEASTSNRVIKDYWDGDKIRMYKDFWDPTKEWEIPLKCTNASCDMYYRTFPHDLRSPELSNSWNALTNEYEFLCSHCATNIKAPRRTVKGDPRNFALMCHWDGFQTASTKPKDSGVVEVVVLNGGKNSIIGALPVLFLPLSLLKLEKKHGDILPYLLEPLICELESAFVDGFSINFNYPPTAIFYEHLHTPQYSCNLRAVLMSWTGDHPAQCKLGCLKDGGKNGCRRDKPPMKQIREGVRIPKYVYTKNRYIARYPPQKRTSKEMFETIRLARRKQTKEEYSNTLSNAGLTGESPLWRLYHLYGFDISLDLVYDVMHILALNLFKKFTKQLFLKASSDTKRAITRAINEVTSAIPRTLRRAGRWPLHATRHHGMFIAEEHQKFIQWCVPHILNSVPEIEKILKDVGMILVDIAHIFYNYTRTHGWTLDTLNATRKLLSAWRILMEEEEGETVSPLEHVAGSGELFDDIVRHGSHDGIWCYQFERNVLGIVEISTNNRFNELTYTNYHNRALLSRILQQLQTAKDGLSPTERILSCVHKTLLLPQGFSRTSMELKTCERWHLLCLSVASSQSQAEQLYEKAQRLSACNCLSMIKRKGIAVHALKATTTDLEGWEITSLRTYWGVQYIHLEGIPYSKIYIHGERYEEKDNVVVKLSANTNSCHENFARGVCKITGFLSHEHNKGIELFLVGEFINAGNGIDALQVDKVTGMRVIRDVDFACKKKCLLPTYAILHKCFFLPLRSTTNKVIYEMSDSIFRTRLLQPGNVGCARPWVEVGDVVLVASESSRTSPSFKVAAVYTINLQRTSIEVGFLKRDPITDYWRLQGECKWQGMETCLEVLHGWTPIQNDNIANAIPTCFKKGTL